MFYNFLELFSRSLISLTVVLKTNLFGNDKSCQYSILSIWNWRNSLQFSSVFSFRIHILFVSLSPVGGQGIRHSFFSNFGDATRENLFLRKRYLCASYVWVALSDIYLFSPLFVFFSCTKKERTAISKWIVLDFEFFRFFFWRAEKIFAPHYFGKVDLFWQKLWGVL